ncbi:TolC family protein [Maribellus maritimus]|uniref:TolC family protein n=1 Tax=Maribellus maritimus TaxID=2870838 RepID=UPI001EEB0A45|nr:TolC family protein [Maribellus maritimus]MCG6191156.1 TolC family protein [Maribellus maritimus]
MAKYIIVIFCSILFAVNVVAQEDTLSLAECKQRALEHSQAIKSARANLQSAEINQKLSKRSSLPNLNLDAGYHYMADPKLMAIPGHPLPTIDGEISNIYSPPYTKELTYHNSYNATIGLSLPLYLGGKLNYARQITENVKNIAESNVELNKIGILLQTEQQYWTLVSLLEQKKVANKSVAFLKEVVTDVTNLYKNGIVTKNEILKAQVELNNVKLFLITINDNIGVLKMAINQNIGNEIETPLFITDSIIEINTLGNSLAFDPQSFENRHEIKILGQQEEINKTEQKIVRSDYFPQLVSYANYGVQNPDHLSNNESELTWNAGLALSIPVFHWGERKLKEQQATLKTETTGYTLDKTKELLTLEIKQAFFKLEEAYSKLNFTKEALVQSEGNLSLEKNKLKQEIVTTTDLLNAQMQWQKSYADFIAAKANVKIQEVLYKKAIGEL